MTGDNKDSVQIQRRRDYRRAYDADHVHLLLSIPPKTSVSSFMGYLKGKSALMMFDKTGTVKIYAQKGLQTPEGQSQIQRLHRIWD